MGFRIRAGGEVALVGAVLDDVTCSPQSSFRAHQNRNAHLSQLDLEYARYMAKAAAMEFQYWKYQIEELQEAELIR